MRSCPLVHPPNIPLEWGCRWHWQRWILLQTLEYPHSHWGLPYPRPVLEISFDPISADFDSIWSSCKFWNIQLTTIAYLVFWSPKSLAKINYLLLYSCVLFNNQRCEHISWHSPIKFFGLPAFWSSQMFLVLLPWQPRYSISTTGLQCLKSFVWMLQILQTTVRRNKPKLTYISRWDEIGNGVPRVGLQGPRGMAKACSARSLKSVLVLRA